MVTDVIWSSCKQQIRVSTLQYPVGMISLGILGGHFSGMPVICGLAVGHFLLMNTSGAVAVHGVGIVVGGVCIVFYFSGCWTKRHSAT